MRLNLVGAFKRNYPFGTEIAFLRGFQALPEHQVTVIDTSYEGEIWDYDADLTLVFKWIDRPEYWKHLASCTGKKVVFQPDDLRFPHIVDMMREMRKFCDFALTFDENGARLAGEMGYRKAAKLLVTADPGLYRPLNLRRDIDVSFVGSLSGGPNHQSRMEMCQLITEQFPQLRKVFLSDVYNIEKIVEIYNRSKIVVNHATDTGQGFGFGHGFQCRHFEVGMTGTCLLSNSVIGDNSLNNFVKFSDRQTLLGAIDSILFHEDWEWMGTHLRDEIMKGHSPLHRANQILDFYGEIS